MVQTSNKDFSLLSTMNQWILALAFAIVAILVYKLWKPMLKPPKAKLEPNEARIYFFYTDWCGFSQKAMPEWEKLEKSLAREGTYGKTHVKPVQVDCEKDRVKCSLYGINSYPTVMLETKDGIHDFNQRPTLASLKGFLRSTLGQERESL
jgi:thiol-disulfide isomerase/thioredoxin